MLTKKKKLFDYVTRKCVNDDDEYDDDDKRDVTILLLLLILMKIVLLFFEGEQRRDFTLESVIIKCKTMSLDPARSPDCFQPNFLRDADADFPNTVLRLFFSSLSLSFSFFPVHGNLKKFFFFFLSCNEKVVLSLSLTLFCWKTYRIIVYVYVYVFGVRVFVREMRCMTCTHRGIR